MPTNRNFKAQARAISQEHGISYTQALDILIRIKEESKETSPVPESAITLGRDANGTVFHDFGNDNNPHLWINNHVWATTGGHLLLNQIRKQLLDNPNYTLVEVTDTAAHIDTHKAYSPKDFGTEQLEILTEVHGLKKGFMVVLLNGVFDEINSRDVYFDARLKSLMMQGSALNIGFIRVEMDTPPTEQFQTVADFTLRTNALGVTNTLGATNALRVTNALGVADITTNGLQRRVELFAPNGKISNTPHGISLGTTVDGRDYVLENCKIRGTSQTNDLPIVKTFPAHLNAILAKVVEGGYEIIDCRDSKIWDNSIELDKDKKYIVLTSSPTMNICLGRAVETKEDALKTAREPSDLIIENLSSIKAIFSEEEKGTNIGIGEIEKSIFRAAHINGFGTDLFY